MSLPLPPNSAHTPYAAVPAQDHQDGYYDPYAAPGQRPHSPGAASGFDLDDAPPRPRFIGPAAGGLGDPQIRDSIASSNYTSGGAAGRPDLSRDSSLQGGYRDEPSPSPVYGTGAGYAATSQGYLSEKPAGAPAEKKSRKKTLLIGGAVVVVAAAVIAGVAVYFGVVKPKQNHTSTADTAANAAATASVASASHSASPSGSPSKPSVALTGGDGSTVTMDDGTTFTYKNSFGGYWYYDENDPLNNGAKPNSWTPALNETFTMGKDRIFGVNLGGWLNTEPFIVPALYEKFTSKTPPATDEWTLSQYLAEDTANGGLNQLEDHYKTFITEKDFADIAAAGLNYVRIPIAWWAIEVRDQEPFLAKTSWTYFLKAIKWARKYGLRINLDLHAIPGSQNGWNHSGRLGEINFLNGPMGVANAQRALDYIRIIAEFISQPQYSDVVTMFGILNEPRSPIFGAENLKRFYVEAYSIIRNIGGVGKGPIISFHDGFQGVQNWAGFMPGADRISLDYHPYLCFDGQPTSPMSAQVNRPCSAWASVMKKSMSDFGLTGAGEFSNAVTDCGKWVNGVGQGTRYEGTFPGVTTSTGDCDAWTDWTKWDDDFKASVKGFAMASMDSLQNWFFWTWKIGNSTVSGKVESPAWSYQLGLEQGWMPTDPRQAAGSCANNSPFSGSVPNGSGNIPASATSNLQWPPTSIAHAGDATLLPSYTQSGSIVTLPGPTMTGSTKSVDAGNGWADASDSVGMYVPIQTCSYLDPWVGPDAAPPSPLCSGSSKKRMQLARVPFPAPTQPPSA